MECYQGYIAIGSVCQEQNPLCKEINMNNGKCLSCWQGYDLQQSGDCAIQKTNAGSSQSQDRYCITYNNNLCTQCSAGYFLNKATNLCKQVDPLCKTFNPDNGACTTCYLGYSVSGLTCAVTVTVSQTPNCFTFTPAGVCIECIDGYYLSGN